MERGPRFWTWVLWVASATAGALLWSVERPPFQDLPQHLAAIRILVDHGDESLRFAEYFEIELLRTQYLAFYLLAYCLALFMPVLTATKVILTATVVATPLSIARLLRVLGRDERLALFAVPLTYNAHLMLGFLNFVAAIPLCFFGLAIAIELRREFTRGRALALGIIALVTFYMHVVPFAFLALGAGLAGIDDVGPSPRRWFRLSVGLKTLRGWLPLAPAAIAVIAWTQLSPAGQSTLTAARPDPLSGAGPVFAPWTQLLTDVTKWLINWHPGEEDEQQLVLWGVLVLATLGLGRATRPAARGAWAIGCLAPLAALAYFMAPDSYDWIWPINARFPLLALFFLIPILPPLRGAHGHALLAALALVTFWNLSTTRAAFLEFDDEIVGIDAAIESIPEGSRVAGIIFTPSSEVLNPPCVPFLHSVAYVQAERGGAVMFTFVDFPQSPIRFREDRRPPRVRPRWEWMPHAVDPDHDLDWYDYVLVRGGPGSISRSDRWEIVLDSEPWRVFRKREAP